VVVSGKAGEKAIRRSGEVDDTQRCEISGRQIIGSDERGLNCAVAGGAVGRWSPSHQSVDGILERDLSRRARRRVRRCARWRRGGRRTRRGSRRRIAVTPLRDEGDQGCSVGCTCGSAVAVLGCLDEFRIPDIGEVDEPGADDRRQCIGRVRLREARLKQGAGNGMAGNTVLAYFRINGLLKRGQALEARKHRGRGRACHDACARLGGIIALTQEIARRQQEDCCASEHQCFGSGSPHTQKFPPSSF
jgi:hypothetical protein